MWMSHQSIYLSFSCTSYSSQTNESSLTLYPCPGSSCPIRRGSSFSTPGRGGWDVLSIDPRMTGRRPTPFPPRTFRNRETNGRTSHAQDACFDPHISSSASGKKWTSRRGVRRVRDARIPGTVEGDRGEREGRASVRSRVHLPPRKGGGEGGGFRRDGQRQTELFLLHSSSPFRKKGHLPFRSIGWIPSNPKRKPDGVRYEKDTRFTNRRGKRKKKGRSKRGTRRGEGGRKGLDPKKEPFPFPSFHIHRFTSIVLRFFQEHRIEARLVSEAWTSSDPLGRSTRRKGSRSWKMQRSFRKKGRIVR